MSSVNEIKQLVAVALLKQKYPEGSPCDSLREAMVSVSVRDSMCMMRHWFLVGKTKMPKNSLLLDWKRTTRFQFRVVANVL